jgi:hypothetical protein
MTGVSKFTSTVGVRLCARGSVSSIWPNEPTAEQRSAWKRVVGYEDIEGKYLWEASGSRNPDTQSENSEIAAHTARLRRLVLRRDHPGRDLIGQGALESYRRGWQRTASRQGGGLRMGVLAVLGTWFCAGSRPPTPPLLADLRDSAPAPTKHYDAARSSGTRTQAKTDAFQSCGQSQRRPRSSR